MRKCRPRDSTGISRADPTRGDPPVTRATRRSRASHALWSLTLTTTIPFPWLSTHSGMKKYDCNLFPSCVHLVRYGQPQRVSHRVFTTSAG